MNSLLAPTNRMNSLLGKIEKKRIRLSFALPCYHIGEHPSFSLTGQCLLVEPIDVLVFGIAVTRQDTNSLGN